MPALRPAHGGRRSRGAVPPVRARSRLTGPARETAQDEGPAGEAQARAGKAINTVYTQHIPEWRAEFDRLAMMLPLEGSSFLKTWWGQDGNERRPRQAYVPVEQVIMPYNDTGDPATVPFIARAALAASSGFSKMTKPKAYTTTTPPTSAASR